MQKKVQDAIEKFHMFPQGAKIIVGLSGGADSVALLYLLCCLRQEHDWELTAVHIHHGLRGADADKDQQFAEAFCQKLGIPCVVRKYDVKAEAKKRRLGEEETGRLLRYEAFREIAGESGHIAVAHHQKDQAETVLMRLCRGTGLKGLTGMSPVRGNVCRPLLFCSREEIEQYCVENGLNWREDATNQEAKYTRNKLRLQVLPILEKINPKAVAHMGETAQLLALEEDFLEQQASACYEAVKRDGAEVMLDRQKLLKLHPAMQKRVLRKAMSEFLPIDVSQIQIEALEDLLKKETGKSRDFLEGIHAENRYDALVLSWKKEKQEQCAFVYALPLGERVFVPEKGIFVRTRLSEKAEHTSEYTKCFDFDKISGEISCRTRKTGDFISMKNGRKKVKDLFIDEKIPREKRSTLPLIVVGDVVLWAVGLRVSQAHQPDETTKTYLYISIEKA